MSSQSKSGYNLRPRVSERTISKSLNKSSKSIKQTNYNNLQEQQMSLLIRNPGYINILSKLININSLRQFVQNVSQFIDLPQQQVQQYINHELINFKKRRYSYLQNSIYLYLEKDFRFLKKYYDLLVQQFSQRKEKIKNQFYSYYKDKVVFKKQFFNKIFNHDDIYKSKSKNKMSYKSKSNKSIIKKSQSRYILSTNKKLNSQNINTSNIDIKSKKKNDNLSLKKPSFTQKKKKYDSKSKQQKNQLNKPSKILTKIKQKQQNKSLKKQKVSLIKSNLKNSRRSTKQNIMIIEQTMQQVQKLSISIKNNKKCKDSKIKQNQKTVNPLININNLDFSKDQNILNEQKLSLKQFQIQQTKQNTKIENNDHEIELQWKQQQLIMRKSQKRKSKKKNIMFNDDQNQNYGDEKTNLIQSTNKKSTKAKSNKKAISFKQFLQKQNDQEKNQKHIATLNELKSISKLKKLQQNNSIFQSCYIPTTRRAAIQSFNKQYESNLKKEQKQIIKFFTSIKYVGQLNDFIFQHDPQIYLQIGQMNGYRLRKRMCYGKFEKYSQPYICLHMQLIQQNQLSKEQQKNKVQLVQSIQAFDYPQITLLILQK